MRLTLGQTVGVRGTKATAGILGTPITENKRVGPEEIRDASDDIDPS